MRRRYACCLVLLLVFPWTRGARAAVTAGTAVNVRVHDTANLDAVQLDRALRVAEATLSAASVDVRWERCRGAGRCVVPMRVRELAVRFVRAPVRGTFRGALPLGDALVNRGAGAGVLATIYVDRVEWLAGVSRGDVATLLGHAVAHELGHLLLASSTHSTGGLMRATWSHHEIREGRAADWTFAAPDIEAMRARLLGLP